LHDQDIINNYTNNIEDRPKVWEVEEHTIEDGPSDHGILNFVDSKCYLAKVNVLFFKKINLYKF